MENETKGKTEVNDVKEIKDVKDYKDAKIKIDIDRYRVKEGDTINLKKFATYCDQDVDKSAVKNYAFPQALDEISLLQAKLSRRALTGSSSSCRRWTLPARTAQSSTYSLISIRTGSTSFPSSSRPKRKRTTITCGALTKPFHAAGISAYLTVPTMKTSSFPASII